MSADKAGLNSQVDDLYSSAGDNHLNNEINPIASHNVSKFSSTKETKLKKKKAKTLFDYHRMDILNQLFNKIMKSTKIEGVLFNVMHEIDKVVNCRVSECFFLTKERINEMNMDGLLVL
jgi:transcriptional regulator with GAF, ATPase, and Fis domain